MVGFARIGSQVHTAQPPVNIRHDHLAVPSNIGQTQRDSREAPAGSGHDTRLQIGHSDMHAVSLIYPWRQKARGREQNKPSLSFLSFLLSFISSRLFFSELNVASKKYYALKRQQEFTFITNGRNSSFNTGRFRFQFTRTVTDIVDGKRV